MPFARSMIQSDYQDLRENRKFAECCLFPTVYIEFILVCMNVFFSFSVTCSRALYGSIQSRGIGIEEPGIPCIGGLFGDASFHSCHCRPCSQNACRLVWAQGTGAQLVEVGDLLNFVVVDYAQLPPEDSC